MAKEKLSRCDGAECEDAGLRKTASERVFDAARSLFYRRGVRAVGVDEIVLEAGVTKPSLYRAYASKDALVAACMDACKNETRSEIEIVLEKAPVCPRARLDAIIDFYSARLQQPDFRGCPLSNIAMEFPEPGHPARAVAEVGKAEFRELLLGLTRPLGVRDPDALADGLLLVLEGAMTSYHLFGSQGPCSAMPGTAQALIDAHVDNALQS